MKGFFSEQGFESEPGKTRVMVSSGITEEGMHKEMFTNVRSAA